MTAEMCGSSGEFGNHEVFDAFASPKASKEVVIVLGQGLNPDGAPPCSLLNRAKKAAALSCERGGLPIIATGGDPMCVGTTEAEVMRAELLKLGVPGAFITMECRSRVTVQNAWEAFSLIPVGCIRVLLVTSEFHMPRAAYIFEAVFAFRGSAFEIERHSADGGLSVHYLDRSCKTEVEVGVPVPFINNWSLPERLRDEFDALQRRTPQDLCSIPGVQIPLPAPERLAQALAEVQAMLSKCEGRCDSECSSSMTRPMEPGHCTT